MYILFIAAAAVIVLPFIKPLRKRGGKTAVLINIGAFAAIAVALTVMMFSGTASAAGEDVATTAAATGGIANGLGYLAAALVTGLATIGSGIAVAAGSTAAIGATSENPKMLTKGLIFVALGEGIALYGLLMSFMILNRLG